MKSKIAFLLTALVIAVGAAMLTMWIIDVADGEAARPTQHTAEVSAYYAVLNLCGGGALICVKRYPVRTFYNCGRNSKCWNICYTHVERLWYLPHSAFNRYKCSTGKISYSRGFLTYSWEY
jgi:hypothetical protein